MDHSLMLKNLAASELDLKLFTSPSIVSILSTAKAVFELSILFALEISLCFLPKKGCFSLVLLILIILFVFSECVNPKDEPAIFKMLYEGLSLSI